MSRNNNDCRIYVGNLPPDVRTKDIEDLFYKFGKITFIDLKNRRGPPFSFVEFDDARYFLQFSVRMSAGSPVTPVTAMRKTQCMPGTGTTSMAIACEWSFRAAGNAVRVVRFWGQGDRATGMVATATGTVVAAGLVDRVAPSSESSSPVSPLLPLLTPLTRSR